MVARSRTRTLKPAATLLPSSVGGTVAAPALLAEPLPSTPATTTRRVAPAVRAAKRAKAVKPVKAAKAVKAIEKSRPPKAPVGSRAAKSAEPQKTPKVEKPVKVEKPRKAKLVRDSFTIPKPEYLVLEQLKQRAGQLGAPIKKSELLRAGIKALAAMDSADYLAALAAVPAIKTGRPAKS